jgi:hypothetical protein
MPRFVQPVRRKTMSEKAAKLHGRQGAVLLAAGALLGALIAGPGGSIAQKVTDQAKKNVRLTTTVADKRYLKAGSTTAAGQVTESQIAKFNQTSFGPLATASVNAPQQGFLQIVGSLSAQDDTATPGAGQLQYRLKVDTTPLSQTAESFQLDLPDGGGRENGSINGVAVVQKGTHQVVLEGQEKGTGSTVHGRSLSAMFVPKGKPPKGKKKKKKPSSTAPTGPMRPPGS